MRDPRLDRLVAPRASDGFRERLGDWIRERERARARAWRRVALAAFVAAVAASATASVLAFGHTSPHTIDRTIACRVPEQGGAPAFDLWANARRASYVVNGRTVPAEPGDVGVDAGLVVTQPWYFAYLATRSSFFHSGTYFDHTACTLAPPIPLVRGGLPAAGVITSADPLSYLDDRCVFAARITIRVRVHLDASGEPVSGRFAIRAGAKQKPLAYIEWTPTRIAPYVSDGYCGPRR